jgi:hypothetical protein
MDLLHTLDESDETPTSSAPSVVSSLPSFVPRKSLSSPQPPSHLVEGDQIMRDIDRPLPGDVVVKARKSRGDLTKRRSAFFEDAFSVKEVVNPAKERVRSEAIVMAEVKTNVIVSHFSRFNLLAS